MKKYIRDSKQFAATFSLEEVVPEVEIKDVGKLAFPLNQKVVRKMLRYARPSKFGLKDETIFDPTIRRSHELPLSRVKIGKRVNSTFFKRAHDSIVSGLGLGDKTKLSIELHSFLINQPGDHFKAHQDTEKAPGMIATLTVVLSSAHKGGGFFVHHQGMTKRFYSSRKSLKGVACCTFFADCVHEVKPVTEGYRVVLTFNISIKERHIERVTPRESDVEKYIALLKPLLNLTEDPADYRESERATVLYYLDHQYTMANLSWSVLKREDLRTARALFLAAKKLNAYAYLVLLEVHETYDAQGNYYSSPRYYGYNNAFDESELEPGELITDEVIASCFLTEDGTSLTANQLSMHSVTSVTPIEHSKLTPTEQEYEGFQGNWGNTLEYWYKRAGVVIWPEHCNLKKLVKLDGNVALSQFSKSSANLSPSEIAVQLSTMVASSGSVRSFKPTKSLFSTFSKLLKTADDQKIASMLLAQFDLEVLSTTARQSLISLAGGFGEEWLVSLLSEVADRSVRSWRYSHISNLDGIVKQLLKADLYEAGRWFIQHEFGRLKVELDRVQSATPGVIREYRSAHTLRVQSLFAAVEHLNDKQWFRKVFSLVSATPRSLDVAMLLKVFRDCFEPNHIAFEYARSWAEKTHDFLKKREKDLAKKQGTWSLEYVSDRSHDLCKKLEAFVISDEKELVWPLAKAGRQYIHGRLDGGRYKISHKTRREGRPYQLVLRKLPEAIRQRDKELALCALELGLLDELV